MSYHIDCIREAIKYYEERSEEIERGFKENTLGQMRADAHHMWGVASGTMSIIKQHLDALEKEHER